MRNNPLLVVPPASLEEEQREQHAGRAETGTTTGRGPRVCKLGRVLELVGADGAALILDRMTDPAWTDRGLSRRLEDAGHYVNPSLFSQHRTGNCICRPANAKGRIA